MFKIKKWVEFNEEGGGAVAQVTIKKTRIFINNFIQYIEINLHLKKEQYC